MAQKAGRDEEGGDRDHVLVLGRKWASKERERTCPDDQMEQNFFADKSSAYCSAKRAIRSPNFSINAGSKSLSFGVFLSTM